MLNSLLPIAFVNRSILPIHFSISVTQIVHILTVIVVAVFPVESALAVLLIVHVVASVSVTVLIIFIFSPSAFAVFEAFTEFANVYGA